MIPRRLQRRDGIPSFVVLLIILALLVASIIPTSHATPLTTQVTIEMAAHNHNNNKNNSTNNSEIEMVDHNDDARMLQLSSLIDILNLGDDNSTCPTECPLCQCNSTEDETCLLSKSIEACASDSFEQCYADILPGEIDVGGLCAIQCGSDDTSSSNNNNDGTNVLCRICDIFACCNECPSEDAAECFPPSMDDGYTPVGWEPADCSNGGGYVGAVAVVAGLSMIMVISCSMFLV